MFLAQQIVYRLDRIKGFDRHLDKDRIPVTHRTVPQTGQFQRFQFAAVLALIGDKAGVLVHIVRQIELLAFIVLQRANQIHRIEVRALFDPSNRSASFRESAKRQFRPG